MAHYCAVCPAGRPWLCGPACPSQATRSDLAQTMLGVVMRTRMLPVQDPVVKHVHLGHPHAGWHTTPGRCPDFRMHPSWLALPPFVCDFAHVVVLCDLSRYCLVAHCPFICVCPVSLQDLSTNQTQHSCPYTWTLVWHIHFCPPGLCPLASCFCPFAIPGMDCCPHHASCL